MLTTSYYLYKANEDTPFIFQSNFGGVNWNEKSDWLSFTPQLWLDALHPQKN